MKFTLTIIVVFVIVLGWLLISGFRSVGNNQGYEPDQPMISYSHKIHAGENQIQCLYCHYGAERSKYAGIPAASTCMNCHKLILKDNKDVQFIKAALEKGELVEWTKVHRLADFVYFSHERHVGAGKIKCQTCHGPVEKMTRMRQDKHLSMGWCIDCHRKTDISVHDGVDEENLVKWKTMKVSEAGGLDCAKCHY